MKTKFEDLIEPVQKDIIKTCDFYNTDIHVLIANRNKRKREFVFPRQVIFYTVRKKYENRVSQEKIGSIFDKDHATVNHSCKTISDLMTTNKYTRIEINQLMEIINNK